jgi:hypothetical protein
MAKGNEIHCYDYVNHPYQEVRDALTSDAKSVFSHATRSASVRARSVASELRVNFIGIELATDVLISVKSSEEKPRETSSPVKTVLQLEWEAAKAPHLFPFMRAELSIYPLTATETQLDFLGRYEPPLGKLGAVMDALVGHRVAEASVHRLLQDVAGHLRATLGKAI